MFGQGTCICGRQNQAKVRVAGEIFATRIRFFFNL
uniref:Uncharacterized protein n=1 Tax=Rhizophora mucronata TaxID=61149 RepID=A0A2P2JQ01_RHIMU